MGRQRSPGTLDTGTGVSLAGERENSQPRNHVTGSRRHAGRKPGSRQARAGKATMAASLGERRLFVGGLGPSVTQDDVCAQLGRFGDVSSVELVSRVNELGSPEKTFAYVNIRLSEGALKACLAALDKSTWKGSALRVQLAKESFLHRLAQERLQAKAEQEQQRPDGTTAAAGTKGGLELCMKAVPGTEVPGRKDWVVSKFGRVLPILHLRSRNRRKILKYDPSKYCHNLKKFEQDVTDAVSISDLTWKLEGGDDVMSKKRQGQFPAFRSCPAKRVKVGGTHCSPSKTVGRPEPTSPAPPNTAPQMDVQKADSRPADLPTSGFSKRKNSHKLEAGFLQTSKSPIVRGKNSVSDDGTDSEEELKAVIAEEKKSQSTAFPETNSTEKDSFEVVGIDFKPKPARSGLRQKSPQAPGTGSAIHLAEDDQEYDLGDTGEIIAGGRNGDQSKDKQTVSSKNKSKQKEDFLKNRANCPFSHHATEMSKRKNLTGNEGGSINCTKRVSKKLSSVSPESEHGESEEDLDYESMMSNCCRLDLTLADLEKLANEDAKSRGGNARCAEQALPKRQDVGSGQKTKKAPKKGARCINPSDILASLLEGEEKVSDQNPPKNNMLKSKFQAFRGVGALYRGEKPKKPCKNSGIATQVKEQNSLRQETSLGSSAGEQAFDLITCSSDEMSPPQDGKEADGAKSLPCCPGKLPRRQPASGDQRGAVHSPSSRSECENASVSSPSSSGAKKPLSLHAEPCRTDLGSDDGLGTPEMGDPEWERSGFITVGPSTGLEPRHELAVLETDSQKPLKLSVGRDGVPSRVRGKDPEGSRARETECPPSYVSPAGAISPPQNCQDNQKRLAALEERRREWELQKRLVHSALSSLDGPPASKPTHILFSSSSEDETEEDSDRRPLPGSGGRRDLASKTSGKLFESSEDEEQETDDEARFQIKPHFEGRAGKKLMSLQSHFGTDDRFRMDARFLESESEEEEEEIKKAETAEKEELIAEKKKNMEVIKNILHVSHQALKLSKEETAAKQFRNIVRYDPTRLDHAAFERKVDPEEKESKAKRRKKREEAEKLPEVSRDLYHSIAADLKERFRATEPAPGAGAAGPWNETPEETEMATATAPGAPDPPGGLGEFTFSFFGPDVGEVKQDPYRTEARLPGHMAWQQDPRFQDSSSEEDEEEPKPVVGSQEVARPEEAQPLEKPARRFFFFSENDERLRVGPGSFWQASGSQCSSEDWESRTVTLLQDCRKKHKAARRKAKP
ncbi:LOW QUALITY PROTEIN: nucleolar protein 8 [Phascolarctos cinereus]|uniref:LOW QUALITY PROTEIN: nucleolar protein 8 n=1 Tax=Phascolarctos cinereus TaxID=38626 RepID=A0A6P5IDD7_PHACI|nr:LOW QUALITY PROTEIN: nucleolar protein 8 [Phascolarctos cinereus]